MRWDVGAEAGPEESPNRFRSVEELLLGDCEDAERDIAMLMRKNEDTLKELRVSMIETKVEFELDREIRQASGGSCDED
jgi:hypothetical protein